MNQMEIMKIMKMQMNNAFMLRNTTEFKATPVDPNSEEELLNTLLYSIYREHRREFFNKEDVIVPPEEQLNRLKTLIRNIQDEDPSITTIGGIRGIFS